MTLKTYYCLLKERMIFSDSLTHDICGVQTSYETDRGYLASPNFPGNYPPKRDCRCSISSNDGSRVRMEVIYLAIHFTTPCADYLKVGNRKICGFSTDMFSSSTLPLHFHSDAGESHHGFWVYFQGRYQYNNTLQDGLM